MIWVPSDLARSWSWPRARARNATGVTVLLLQPTCVLVRFTEFPDRSLRVPDLGEERRSHPPNGRFRDGNSQHRLGSSMEHRSERMAPAVPLQGLCLECRALCVTPRTSRPAAQVSELLLHTADPRAENPHCETSGFEAVSYLFWTSLHLGEVRPTKRSEGLLRIRPDQLRMLSPMTGHAASLSYSLCPETLSPQAPQLT